MSAAVLFNDSSRIHVFRTVSRRLACSSIFSVLMSVLVLNATPGFLVPCTAAEGPMRLSQYQGQLSQASNGEKSILREFEVLLFSSESGHFFHVLDDTRAGCPWPDSFGKYVLGNLDGSVQPHLLYTYENVGYAINLPPLVTEFPQNADVDSEWDQDGWKFTLLERRQIDGIDCWMVEARERRGRRQTMFVDSSTGQLVRAQADVFMGQGDQFRLNIGRSSVNDLPQSAVGTISELQTRLVALQKAMNRRIDSQLTELSDRQIQTVEAERASLHELAEGTPLQELVMRISTDLRRQQDRLKATTSRASQLMDTAAPRFSLNLVNGGTLQSEQLQGRIVVLHFWDYRDQPLAEPYGQTGYLDFIYNQRRKLNVEVIGVTTSSDFLTPENIARGRRSVRKLSEFMNLTYPIAYDDGSLLRSLGDPRESNGQLPLWVVLSADGKVAHYHTGFYEIDVTRGLQQLDDILIQQIRDAKQPTGK